MIRNKRTYVRTLYFILCWCYVILYIHGICTYKIYMCGGVSSVWCLKWGEIESIEQAVILNTYAIYALLV